VTDIKFSLSQDPAHDSHGLVVKVKGQKPGPLDTPVHLALSVEGGGFWRSAASVFGEFPVGFARY